ncbi:MAG: hypothetical protein ACFFCB_08700 [Candidatus Odinarchaeota archaeon]
MNETAFRQYLSKQKVDPEQVTIFVNCLEALQKFQKSENIDSLPRGKILRYTEHLVNVEPKAVLDTLRALINYGNFIKNYDYVAEVLDIAEAYNAMDNLYGRVAEHFGEQVRDEIFAGIELPPLGTDPEPKFEVTKLVMKRLENTLGEDKTIELLAPCLHGRDVGPKAREDFLRLNDIDAFLKEKHQVVIDRFRQHMKNGTLEWAQYVDKDVVDYVENTPTISPGIREGDKIISTKVPYQIKKMLDAKDRRMKRYYVCYCPWVRGAIKNGTEDEISPNFCHCSAGFTKLYWDIIFDQPVTVEPIETALTGALHCKFTIQIPKEYQTFIP